MSHQENVIIKCDRCNFKIEYKEDYLFGDGMFYGDNLDRAMFKEDEVVCINCIEGDANAYVDHFDFTTGRISNGHI